MASTQVEQTELSIALNDFKKQFPNTTSGDLQSFILGWQACQINKEISTLNAMIALAEEYTTLDQNSVIQFHKEYVKK